MQRETVSRFVQDPQGVRLSHFNLSLLHCDLYFFYVRDRENSAGRTYLCTYDSDTGTNLTGIG